MVLKYRVTSTIILKLLQYNPVPRSKTQTLYHGLYHLHYHLISYHSLLKPPTAQVQPNWPTSCSSTIPSAAHVRFCLFPCWSLCGHFSPNPFTLFRSLQNSLSSLLLSLSHFVLFFPYPLLFTEITSYTQLICWLHSQPHMVLQQVRHAETSAALEFVFLFVIKLLRPKQQRGANTAHLVNS